MKNHSDAPPSTLHDGRRTLGRNLLASFLLFAASVLLGAQTGNPFEYRVQKGEVIITGYNGVESAAVIPQTIEGLPVTTVASRAFAASRLTRVVIPEGVTTIGSSAFVDNLELSQVTLPNSLALIEDRAFQRCAALNRLEIPKGVSQIGELAFDSCTRLSQVVLGESLVSLQSGLFHNCTALTELTIPDSVSFIVPLEVVGQFAVFENCGALRQVHLGRGVIDIRWGWNSVFLGCTNLTSITVANDHPTFLSLDGVLLGREILSLEFVPMGREGRYEIPKGVTSIARGAFQNCRKLTEIEVPGTVLDIGDLAFAGCAGLQQIRLPDSVTTLGSWAFAGCTHLEEVSLGAAIPALDRYAFIDCSGLVRVSVGRSLHWIDRVTFSHSPGLRELYFQGNAPTIAGDDPRLVAPQSAQVFFAPGTAGWTSTFGGLPTVEWRAGLRLAESERLPADASFPIKISGAPGLSGHLEVTLASNLAAWTWVKTITLPTSGVTSFLDSDSDQNPVRLYRFRMP